MSDSSKIISPWGKGSMRALREIPKAHIIQEVGSDSETTSEISNKTIQNKRLASPGPSSPLIIPIQNKTLDKIANEISNKITSETSTKPSNKTSSKISSKTSNKTSNETPNRPSLKTSNEISSETSNETLKRRYIHLDSTHTSAEQKVYSVMYRETISKGINGRRFSVAELMELTGINSNTTIIRALRGLAEKYSIEVISRDASRRYGVLYKIHMPSEITQLRNENNILIEHRRKEIIKGEKGTWDETSNEISNETSSETSRYFGRHVVRYAENKHLDMQKINISAPRIIIGINKEKLRDDEKSSSSQVQNDDEKLAKVRELFEQISNGGSWKEERDSSSFEQIKHVHLWHVIMGLCYSVVCSPEHKFNSLAYAVPSILEHAKQMSIFSEQDMLPIAYKTMRQTINCIQSGKWNIPEWLAGDGTTRLADS